MARSSLSEYEELDWVVVHGRGVLHTGVANAIVQTLATGGTISGRESYYYMRYDDSPERDYVPMMFYAAIGRPNIDFTLREEVEPIGQIFNAIIVLDSSMLLHRTSQRALLFDGAKNDAVLVVNSSLSASEVTHLVKRYSLRGEWKGRVVTVRAREYDKEIAYPLLGALAKASSILTIKDLRKALEALNKSEKIGITEQVYSDAKPANVNVSLNDGAMDRTAPEEPDLQRRSGRWNLKTYREYQRAASEASSYSARLAAMPRWEALAPGLVEFGPLPGEKNIGFTTSFDRCMRPAKNDSKCTDCKLCHLYCPDGAIDFESIKLDMNYCTGCGICSEVCPTRAITMMGELQAIEGMKEQEISTIGDALREYGY